MKNFKAINVLVILIIALSLVCSLYGLFSNDGPGQYQYTSINREAVKIFGTGLYKNDSVSVAAQGKASDLITLLVAIPLLLISRKSAKEDSFRGKLMLTGTLGYFLYTYMSYAFLWMYNPFFIAYVVLMSASFFAFILCFMSFDVEKVGLYFRKQLPVRFLGGFQIFIGVALLMLWLGKIAPSVFEGKVPVGLEHYTTLVIQGMDLGFIVPTAFISGILLIKRKPFGYLLTSIVIIKAITMLTSISAMIINQALNGVSMNIAETVMFPLFNLLAIICMYILMKNIIKEKATAN